MMLVSLGTRVEGKRYGEHALSEIESSISDLEGLRCLRIDQKSKGENAAKMFKNDPSILVLLLHGFESLSLSLYVLL